MSDVVLRPHSRVEGRFVLDQPLVYRGKRDTFIVPAGFSTDLASVPRFLWPLLPPYGRHTKAAVIHDWLYFAKPDVRWDGQDRALTRADADGIFRRIMRENNVPAWRRWALWAGVRIGGSWAWSSKHRGLKA